MRMLEDLFSTRDLSAAIGEGYVRQQFHPSEPFAILNYTEQAVYSRTWTPVTKQCRGLIVNTQTSEILARPWSKFFNYGEHVADELDLGAPVEVTDKADGSLGILYYTSAGPAIATRGSFMSEQAQHATAIFCERYASGWASPPGCTALFEIVYPANRIVLDYGTMDDLILLGSVNIDTGEAFGPGTGDVNDAWPGPVIDVHPYRTLADALAAEPRANAEGLVVRYLDGDLQGTMLKLKQEDYVALHRIVTGLTARRLWERTAIFEVLRADPEATSRKLGQVLRMDPLDVQGIVAAGPDWLDEIRQTMPEEFTDWINATVLALHQKAEALADTAVRESDACRDLPRKEAAMRIAKMPERALIFSLLDGKSITAQTWAAIRPEAERPMLARGEDVA